MIGALLALVAGVSEPDLDGLRHDACVRTAVLWRAERTRRPASWGQERTWGLCWRTPSACVVEGCP